MNIKHLIAAALLIPTGALAASVSGTLVANVVSEQAKVVVKGPGGKTVEAYCFGYHCGDIFENEDENGYFHLKKRVAGKKVVVTYRSERSDGRILGYQDKDAVLFVTNLEFVR